MAGGEFSERLCAWYRRARRDLPWRRSRDAYRIWVSEVMLQQTRVEAVKPYYERFLAEFPTLAALAEAPLERVLARWSGLGYYRRAAQLHGAVRECVARYAGRVPRRPEELGALPGVGPYTTAAVLSIAFDVPLAVVDGNVVRVLARHAALEGHARSPRLVAAVRERALALLPREAPGDFNQALMELGALVCTPRRPRCEGCPVAASCRARALGEPERFPAPAPRKAPRAVVWAAALVERKGRWLLVKRASEGRFGGMWELPWMLEPESGPGGPWLGAGARIELGEELVRLRHSVLNERITLRLCRGRLRGRLAKPGQSAWVAPGELDDYGLSSLWLKALEALGARARAPQLFSSSGPGSERRSKRAPARRADTRRA